MKRYLTRNCISQLLEVYCIYLLELTYAVNNVAKFSSHPTIQHWTGVKRIMRYLKGTTNLGLLYSKKELSKCVGYSDSDWGGDFDDRKSTSGYIFPDWQWSSELKK